MPPLPFWFQGKDTALDITVVNPLQGEVLQVKWEGPLNIQCRAQETKFYYNIAFIPLWTLECSVGSVWYNICSSAMAGLTHGAVALPVIMGQRSEATPYPTIHKGSHTIHNVYTSTMDCNAGGRVAKAWDWGRAPSGQEQGAFQVMVPHSDHHLWAIAHRSAGCTMKRSSLASAGLHLQIHSHFWQRRMVQEEAHRCIWLKDWLELSDHLEIQMFIFPSTKSKVPMNY